MSSRSIILLKLISIRPWCGTHVTRRNLPVFIKGGGNAFRSEKKRMQELLALREDKPAASLPGDTVDVWYDRKLYWLTDVPLANKVTFEIPADSNFKARMLSCGLLIIYSFRKGNGEPLWDSIFCLIMILWWGV